MRIAACFLAAAALILGCGDGTSGWSPGGEDYFPFSTGNSWSYDRTGSVDTLGFTLLLQGDRAVSVTDVDDMGDYYLVKTAVAGYDTLADDSLGGFADSLFIPLGGPVYLREDDQAIYQYTDTLMTDSVCLAMFPLEQGMTWLYSTSPQAEAEVMSLDETVAVPAGEFSDVAYIRITQSGIPSVTMDRYYAPGVGNIRNVTEVEQSGVTVYELIEECTSFLVL